MQPEPGHKKFRLSRFLSGSSNGRAERPGPQNHPDSAYASSENAEKSTPNIVQVENDGVFPSSNKNQNLALNRNTGEVFDEDTGHVVTTVTTTTTTTTTTTAAGGQKYSDVTKDVQTHETSHPYHSGATPAPGTSSNTSGYPSSRPTYNSAITVPSEQGYTSSTAAPVGAPSLPSKSQYRPSTDGTDPMSPSRHNFSYPSRTTSGMTDTGTPTGTAKRSSKLADLKAAAIGLHGVGETLRGTINSTVDQNFQRRNAEKNAYAAAKNEATLARGRNEVSGIPQTYRQARTGTVPVTGQETVAGRDSALPSYIQQQHGTGSIHGSDDSQGSGYFGGNAPRNTSSDSTSRNLRGDAADGSHSAVFGLTHDGHKHHDTDHSGIGSDRHDHHNPGSNTTSSTISPINHNPNENYRNTSSAFDPTSTHHNTSSAFDPTSTHHNTSSVVSPIHRDNDMYDSSAPSRSTNAGPHNSNALNKLDPRVDSDLDNRNNTTSPMGTSTGGYGSSTPHTTYGSTNTGPHNSNILNKADPRVDSDTDRHNDNSSRVGGYGTQDRTTTGSTNAGPHNSNMMNKLDPRVDSDFDNRNNQPSRTGGYGTQSSTSGPTNYGPHNSSLANKADPRVDSDGDHRNDPISRAGGYGTQSGTSGSTNYGPHNSNLLNKADPRVDSDGDHRNDPTSRAGGYGTQEHTTGSTNAGPHNSNLLNKADPRVDSDMDGHSNPSSKVGGYGGQSHTTGSTNTGPHNSNLLNKADPRVDSDRDNRNDPTSRIGGYGAQDNNTTSSYNPTRNNNNTTSSILKSSNNDDSNTSSYPIRNNTSSTTGPNSGNRKSVNFHDDNDTSTYNPSHNTSSLNPTHHNSNASSALNSNPTYLQNNTSSLSPSNATSTYPDGYHPPRGTAVQSGPQATRSTSDYAPEATTGQVEHTPSRTGNDAGYVSGGEKKSTGLGKLFKRKPVGNTGTTEGQSVNEPRKYY